MQPMRLHLISWNTANRKSAHVERQVQAIAKCCPDIVAIQEIVESKVERWRELLQNCGYCNAVHNLRGRKNRKGPRKYGQMIASRWKLKPLPPTNLDRGWSERLLSAIAVAPGWGKIEIHTTHIPHGSGHYDVKVHTLNGIYKRLARRSSRARILCGDLNTPKEEERGRIITFGQARRNDGSVRFVSDWGKEWDCAERGILEGLGLEFGLVDAYRQLHPYKKGDFSWYSRTNVGRRFDHIFAAHMRPIKCRYLHRFRTSGLSDHSAVEAVFAKAS